MILKEKKEESEYKDFFIRYKDFWKNGEPTQEQVDKIYKRKPRAPYIEVEFGDGTKEKIWCTFDAEQVDLNVQSPVVKEFIKNTLINMCKKRSFDYSFGCLCLCSKKSGH